MNYISLFSGIGGFELGIQRAYDNQPPRSGAKAGQTKSDEDLRQVRQREAIQELPRSAGGIGDADSSVQLHVGGRTAPLCVGYSEIDKHAIKTYEEHFEHANFGDITKLDPAECPDFDLLVGGFPCQAFSIAGKRGGFNDTRGTLFFDVARILKDKRPRHLVLENVKGLLSHDSGKTFATILGVLTDLGYDIEWQVLNSKNFGVPQNRERIYIVGHLRGKCTRKILPIIGSDTTALGSVATTFKDADGNRKLVPTARFGAVTATYYKGAQSGGRPLVRQINQPKHSNDRVYADDGISPTLNTMQGGNRQPFVASVLTPDRLEKRQNGRRIKGQGEPSFTLTSQDKHGVQIDAKIRRLTPTECERLQGFPDNWTIGSDTQRYKQCGNAVTVNVVAAVMGRLKDCL